MYAKSSGKPLACRCPLILAGTFVGRLTADAPGQLTDALAKMTLGQLRTVARSPLPGYFLATLLQSARKRSMP